MSKGITCPACGSTSTYVSDSRPAATHIRRRRLCRDCGARTSSIERVLPPGRGVTVIVSRVTRGTPPHAESQVHVFRPAPGAADAVRRLVAPTLAPEDAEWQRALAEEHW